MKIGQVLSVASLGVSLATACGNTGTSTADSGGGSGSASSSGSSASTSGGSSGGSGSSSGSSSGSTSGSGSGSSSGSADAGNTALANDCPNCAATGVCCVSLVGGVPTGTCSTPAACSEDAGTGAINCMTPSNCPMGQICCATAATSTSPPSAACAASCPAATYQACDTAMDCPGGGAGYVCQAAPLTDQNFFTVCIPSDAGAAPAEGGADAGADGGAMTDTGPQDAPAPTDGGDAAPDMGTQDAPAPRDGGDAAAPDSGTKDALAPADATSEG